MSKLFIKKVKGAINGTIGEVSEPYNKRGVEFIRIVWQSKQKPYEIPLAHFYWLLRSRGLVEVKA